MRSRETIETEQREQSRMLAAKRTAGRRQAEAAYGGGFDGK
jgi:hypothetical protein